MARAGKKRLDGTITVTITLRGVLTALAVIAAFLTVVAAVLAVIDSTRVHAVMPTEVTDPIVDTADVSEGVAATVGGVEIGEKCITAYIENFRASEGLEDDDDWGTWVIENGYTIAGIRSDTLDTYIAQELIRQAAAQEGVSVTDDEVVSRVQEAIDEAEQDEGWEAALEELAMTEEAYFANVEVTLLEAALSEALCGEETATDEEVLELIVANAEDYEDAESLDEVDDDTLSSWRAYADSQAVDDAFDEWMAEFQDATDIVEESLPDDVSYNIDLTAYEEAYYASLAEDEE